MREAVDRAAAELGALHTVVSNAGIGSIGTVEDNADNEWTRVLDINVLGMVRTARHALPHLRRAAADRPGAVSITQTCSIAATAGLPQRALYSASKGAVRSLTLAMAADHVREGIRVNCVNPGTADTPWIGFYPRPGRRPGRRTGRAQRPPAAGTARLRRRGRRRDRLPREPRRRLGHRHGTGRRRRHAGAAPAPRRELTGEARAAPPAAPPRMHLRFADRNPSRYSQRTGHQ